VSVAIPGEQNIYICRKKVGHSRRTLRLGCPDVLIEIFVQKLKKKKKKKKEKEIVLFACTKVGIKALVIYQYPKFLSLIIFSYIYRLVLVN
jgi:hypothetical protein